eukprot:TRINITY_DN61403_c0_g1_i1.p1 TRINITY_DN61403_c0_g1~~TRINITY_DN61403_c0_g1_i1.p1  ORF type:complete len:493 (-),score=68.38 TRINITY_DN61403_c0_g1_i1:58-1536(-)
MGRRQASGNTGVASGIQAFASSLRRQLADKQRQVRVFDIGGTGVKTALFSAHALRDLLHDVDGSPELTQSQNAQNANDDDMGGELLWLESPRQLGSAPGDEGFAAWLRCALPRLQREVDDPRVCFGVSIGGDVEHASGKMRDWWPGGGHPREWDDGRPNPLVADLMGLPRDRTFAIHDGEAHLLGCSRRIVPPSGLACFALGTGIGFGLADDSGAVVDPSSLRDIRSHHLGGVPLSGAAYKGIWRQWLNKPGGANERVDDVMARDFANMSQPWSMPWVSLVLGRRGMELAEASHGCPEPTGSFDDVNEVSVALEADASPIEATDGESSSRCESAIDRTVALEKQCDEPLFAASVDPRAPAVLAFGEQWLHFLHTQFVPQFTGKRRHPVKCLCFAGGVAELNWPLLSDVLTERSSCLLRPPPVSVATETSTGKRGRGAVPRVRASGNGASGTVAASHLSLPVLPLAPRGSGLIGAGIYALAGIGGVAATLWAE